MPKNTPEHVEKQIDNLKTSVNPAPLVSLGDGSKQTDFRKIIADSALKSYSYLIPLYHLKYRHHNEHVIFLEATAQQDENTEADQTQYWYRCFTSREFDWLNRNNRFYPDAYGGIAPYRQYVRQGYFNNNSQGTHIVEFKTPKAGWLFVKFTKERRWTVKAEGGGTYGLGPTGCDKGAAGAAFNQMLALGQITWELVDLKIKNTLP